MKPIHYSQVLLTVLSLFALAPLTHAATYQIPNTNILLEYEVTSSAGNGTVKITDCNTNALGELVIPETIEGFSVTQIDEEVFKNCTSLTHITFPEGLTRIQYKTVYNCYNLTSVTLPNSITTIEDYAFFGCSSLTDLSLPESLTSIGNVAFSGCYNLTEVTIPQNVIYIDSGAFSYCFNLRDVIFEGDAPEMGSWDVFDYTDYYLTLYYYQGAYGFSTPTWYGYYTSIIYVIIFEPGIALNGDLDFGSITVGESSTRTLTITNTGLDYLSVPTISLPNAYSCNWEGGTIAIGSSQEVLVTFSPTDAGEYNGIITVLSNATKGENTIAVSGEAIAKEPIISRAIVIRGDFEFGQVPMGESATGTFTISNPGNSTLTITSFSYPAGFSGNWDSGSIGSKASQEIKVTFTPSALRSYTGALSVECDATHGTNNVTLSGRGTDPEPDNPRPYALRDAENFGGGYYLSEWFGGFFKTDASDTFLFTMDFGWTWVDPSATANSMWWWSFNLNSWMWGSQDTDRFFYRNSDSSWIYVISEPTGGCWIQDSSSNWTYLGQ